MRGGFRLLCLLMVLVLPAAVSTVGDQARPLRIGLAAVFLDQPRTLLDRWAAYLEKRIGRPVQFVQRRTYGELMDGLLKGDLQAAWICTYPYVSRRNRLGLLAVPSFRGRSRYRSYLIVNAEDHATRDIRDLAGKVFAYTDNRSLSGYLVPRRWLEEAGFDPNHFFGATFFTWSHRNSIEAVADGLADGAAVDSYIWESMARRLPEITARTRVVRRSAPYGFPPLVAERGLDPRLFQSLQQALLDMNRDEEGRALLQMLNLDGFVLPDDRLYESAVEFVEKGK